MHIGKQESFCWGDPALYDPACRGKTLHVIVRWLNESYENSTARESLREIRAASDEFKVSRASIVLWGQLSAARKENFGHLGWADLEFKIDDVERAESVPKNVRWPKQAEDAYRKARKLLLSGETKKKSNGRKNNRAGPGENRPVSYPKASSV